MMAELLFKSGGESFVAEVDGYLCFVTPTADAHGIRWEWDITSGGGWTNRGGESVTSRATGWAINADGAEREILAWLEKNAE